MDGGSALGPEPLGTLGPWFLALSFGRGSLHQNQSVGMVGSFCRTLHFELISYAKGEKISTLSPPAESWLCALSQGRGSPGIQS